MFGGTIALRSKHNAVTPLVRYSSTPSTGETSGLYIAEGSEVRTSYTYPTDIAPIEIPKANFTSGEFAYDMNNLETSETKWIMSSGYAVPWGDESTTIHKVTVDGKIYYTEPDGTLADEILDKGTYWYRDGVCYTVEDAKTWVYTDDTAELTIGLSSSSNGADYDGSNDLSTADALLLLKFIDGVNTELDNATADINADGKVTVYDAVKLLQIMIDLNT